MFARVASTRADLSCCIALLLAACAAGDPQRDDETPSDSVTDGASGARAGTGGAGGNVYPQGGAGAGNDPDGSGVTAGAGGTDGGAGAGGADVATGMPGQDTAECTPQESAAACDGIACGAAPTCRRFCGACSDDERCIDGQCEPRDCGQLDLAIETFGACALDVAGGVELDGEGFIDAGGRQQRVFALDRWGTGHFVAWCDSSTLVDLVTGVNARRYLGRSDGARVASFGDDFMCNPASISSYPLPPWVTYFGLSLPAEYRDAPAALAADWDAIIYCGYRAEWDDAWVPTLQAFVSEHGRGLLAALDYAGVDATPPDFAHMNSLVAPTGVTFLEVLNYAATASVSVADECVPDFVPPPD